MVAGGGVDRQVLEVAAAALLIVADTLPASTYTSSLGAATLTVPVLAPAAMVIVAPLLSVTVTGVCAAAGQRRGVGDRAAFGDRWRSR